MKSLPRDVVRIYENKQRIVEAAREKRQKQAEEEIPPLAELLAERDELRVKSLRQIAGNQDDAGTASSEKIIDITRKIGILLSTAGYRNDWMDPWWECAQCHDTGYKLLPNGFFGEPCACSAKLVTERLFQSCNLALDDRISFEKFDITVYPEKVDIKASGVVYDLRAYMWSVLDAAKVFVEKFDEDKVGSLLFYGKVGTGKSFLAKCIGKALMEKGHPVIFLTVKELLDVCRKMRFYSEGQKEAEAKYQQFAGVDLLVLDDLGVEVLSGKDFSDLLGLFEDRQKPAGKMKRMIVTTNLTLREIQEQYSERFFSRLAETYDFIPFEGPDARLAIRKRLIDK